MNKPDQKIINEIAQELDCGNECYFNQKTKELICLPNAELMETAGEDYYKEMFQDDFKKIESQKKDLIKFEVLESFESFKIMEDYKNQVEDDKFQENLDQALIKRKPFQNFKNLIDNSEYREQWFEFKQREIEKIVVKTIERKNASI
ncbi:hypothetical protein [uncultured Christiangramia sp.]|uniref:hypothetical protein n=1 Tax=uncultured Christiangramia sp. TaxID=503836 RepID=UPI0026179738|nr:hypothetical protein [uncultured Christiangramia sp.]